MIALAEFAIKSLVVLLLAGTATLILRRLGAAYRHLIWTAAFCAILALPALQAALPSLRIITVPAAKATFGDPPIPVSNSKPEASNAEWTKSPRAIVAWPLTSNQSQRDATPADVWIGSLAPSALSSIHGPVPGLRAQSSLRPSLYYLAPLGLLENALTALTPTLLAVWILGALICLGQHLISLAILNRTASKGTRLDATRFRELAARVGVNRPWSLIQESAASGPRTWGSLRPVIAMPKSSLEWAPERLEAALLHEFIHVQRMDSLSQSIAAIACALNWFNPLVWICASQARKEAERAADDAVLRAGVKPSVYAETLVQTALESKSSPRRFLTAGVPLMKQSKIEARIRAILSNRRTRPASRIGVASTAIAALALTLPCAALTAGARQPQPLASELDAVEVTHTQTAQPPAKSKKSIPVRHHKTQATADARAQIAELKAELAAQREQLAAVKVQLQAVRMRERAQIDAGKSNRERAELDRVKAQAELEASQAEIMKRNAELAAKNAQVNASKAELDEVAKRVRAGVAENQELNRKQADLAVREADMQAAKADMAQAVSKLRAAKAGAEIRMRNDAKSNGEADAVAKLRAVASQAQLKAAIEQLRRQKALYDQGAVSSEQLAEEAARLQDIKAALAAKARADGTGARSADAREALAVAKMRLNNLLEKLSDLRTIYKDSSPQVQAVMTQIAEQKAYMRSLQAKDRPTIKG